MQPMEFDYIVVGAGSAGCVVATRLSETPSNRVLLIEAGADVVPEPSSVAAPYPISHGVPAFRWPGLTARLKAPLRADAQAPATPFVQARLVGGGGSLMGMFALRGLPRDYDEWRDNGALGWGWADVLASFRRLEQDHDFAGEAHGGDGPIPIRRYPREQWSPFAQALGGAFEADGHPFIADANADFRDGHVVIPSSRLPHRRVSSASAYLDARTRARRNLTILIQTEVQHVLFDGRRAIGVRASTPDGPASYRARAIVLCAGAIHSPRLLLQSGVGPARDLHSAGVTLVHDLPGVGGNLSNHAIIYLAALIPPAFRRPGGPAIFNALRYSSGLPDCPPQDMLMPVLNRTAWHALGDSFALLGASVYKPASRGRIRLARGGDGGLSADVDFAFFSDARDLARLTEGFKRIYRYLSHAAAALPGAVVFAPTNMRLMAQLAEPRAANAALAWALAAAIDAPLLQQHAMRRAGIAPATLMDDEDRLRDFVYQHSSPMFHPAGSCRIGAQSDPDAVVDPRCRVIGVSGLCVADASVMPSIVRGNTNIPTLMIGEKAAAMIMQDDTHHAGDGV